MATALVNGRVLRDGGLVDGLAVVIEGPRLDKIRECGRQLLSAIEAPEIIGGVITNDSTFARAFFPFFAGERPLKRQLDSLRPTLQIFCE